jgi:hypothetical protein
MACPHKLHEKAYEDYLYAYEWYESKKTGLGNRFMECVEKKIFQITEHPEFYSRKQNTRYRETKIDNFPYTIVYEFFPRKNIIHIAAIHHEKRNTLHKYRRMK